ncbi:hypothetical protein GGI22_004911, partial [Coemansia erecta]
MQFRPGMTPQQQHAIAQHQLYMANRGAVTPQQQAQYVQHLQQQQQQQQQQQMAAGQIRPPGMAYPQQMGNVRPGLAGISPQQQQQQQQQNQFIHPGTASIAVAGVGIQGQQPHPALVQAHGQQGRKRKSKGLAAHDSASNIDDGGSGDELDGLQPYN